MCIDRDDSKLPSIRKNLNPVSQAKAARKNQLQFDKLLEEYNKRPPGDYFIRDDKKKKTPLYMNPKHLSAVSFDVNTWMLSCRDAMKKRRLTAAEAIQQEILNKMGKIKDED